MENLYIPQSEDYDINDISADAVIEFETVDPRDLPYDLMAEYIREHLPRNK